MIGVGGVLELDLPIAGKAELVFAKRRHRIAGALLHEQVDPLLRRPEKVGEWLDILAEGCKDHAGIFLDAQRAQRQLGLVEHEPSSA